MGIRFACFECKKPLHIKTELAGKRGVCPQCGTRFRIPDHDTDYAIPIADQDAGQDAPPDVSTPAARAANAASHASAATSVGAVKAAESTTAMPSLLNDPNATWYVRPPSGGQYGPATGEILRQWIGEGRLTPTTLIWRDGWAQWRAANEALVEFGATPKSPTKPITEAVVAINSVAPTAAPTSRSAMDSRPDDLTGDAQIGVRKSKITQRRFVIVGTLTAISLTMIGVLIFLLQT